MTNDERKKINIGKILDWPAKNLGRIKTVGILVLIVLLGFSILRGACNRQQMEELTERVAGLNVRNDILRQGISKRDSLIIQKDGRIAELKDSILISVRKLTKLKSDYSYLKAEYESLSDDLLVIPVDSSYDFLVNEAYPYEGHRKYPFNEPQVKGIHLTYLENISLVDMKGNLIDQINELGSQLQVKDMIVDEQDIQLMLMKQTHQDLDSIVDNKDEVIEVKDKQIKKERRNKTIWQTTMGVLIVVLSIFAVGGG
jgi:hypothetical protein